LDSISSFLAFFNNPAPFQFPGDDDLRGLEKNQVPIFHILAVVSKNMKILPGVSVRLQEGTVKGVVDFKERKVFKIIGQTLPAKRVA